MIHEHTKTIEIAGIEIDVQFEFEANYVDVGIGPYEYWGARGSHHDWTWEIDCVLAMTPEEDIYNAIRRTIVPSMFRNRKSYLKCVRRKARQIARSMAKDNPYDYVNDNELREVCRNITCDEPDYYDCEE